MTNNPKISVLLPIKNGEVNITNSISSIINQTFSNFELLIIINGALGDTHEYISTHYKDHRIRILHLDHPSIVDALNFGIANSKGEFLARMDADDTCNINRFEEQLSHLTTSDIALSATQVEFSSNIKKSEGLETYVNWQNNLLTYQQIFLAKFIESPIIHPTVMFKRAIIQKFNDTLYQQGDFPEDYDLWLRILGKGLRIEKLEKKLLTWFDHKKKLTRIDPRYSTEAFYKLKAMYVAKHIKQNYKNRNIYVWGAGKESVKRARNLLNHEINIKAYIDVNPKLKYSKDLIFYKDLHLLQNPLILNYVGNRNARKEIHHYLISKDLKEGIDFLHMA